MEFVKFMSSGGGRLTRAVAGVVLIGVGFALGGGWLVLSVIGLVPLFAGIANVCLLAPLMGQPFKGR
jgi:hypothetical protein